MKKATAALALGIVVTMAACGGLSAQEKADLAAKASRRADAALQRADDRSQRTSQAVDKAQARVDAINAAIALVRKRDGLHTTTEAVIAKRLLTAENALTDAQNRNFAAERLDKAQHGPQPMEATKAVQASLRKEAALQRATDRSIRSSQAVDKAQARVDAINAAIARVRKNALR